MRPILPHAAGRHTFIHAQHRTFARLSPADGRPVLSYPRRTLTPVTTPAARARRFATETPIGRTRRARRMTRELAEIWPDAHCELDFTTPLELAVATILSAQSTDAGVNKVTPALFARYRTAADYAKADRAELETMIKSTGFFRNKTSSLIGLGQHVEERYGGELPSKLEDLVTLPGIGRKTANVIIGNAFGGAGITVDTHFQRLVHRWQWTEEKDPVKIESAVAAMIPRKEWTDLSQRTIWHGRRICHARRPACGACALAHDCPAYGTGPVDPDEAAKLVKTGAQVAVAR